MNPPIQPGSKPPAARGSRWPVAVTAAAPFASVMSPALGAGTPGRKRLGVCAYSYNFHWRAAREKNPKARFKDAVEFADYCHELGAGGVQVAVDAGHAAAMRARIESHGMYFEGVVNLPRDTDDLDRFETDVRASREAGAAIVRTACLGGRRYETFESADAFEKFAAQSWKSLTLAEPVVRKHGVKLAVENHKDWRVPELLDLLRRLSSEHVGVCVDTGNSIALLENPLEVVEALAPFAFSTHLKDMAVQNVADGFLLSEVPLGRGFLDLKKFVALLEKSNPRVQYNLEMITRDPLRIPCLADRYWATMKAVPARDLAAALNLVREKAATNPLPRTTGLGPDQQLELEDKNVRDCIAAARSLLEG
jgi:sugar phosphate isomerase/epimerase